MAVSHANDWRNINNNQYSGRKKSAYTLKSRELEGKQRCAHKSIT